MQPVYCRGFHFYEAGEKWLARGVTYGPFKPDDDGFRYPAHEQVRQDMAAISRMGANALRLYDIPPDSLVQTAAEHGLRVLIDIPWPKHLDVYDSPELRRRSIEHVEEGVRRVLGWESLVGILLGNEIPSDLTRWRGPERVEKLLYEMYVRAKAIAPDLPIGYANFPSTEYLGLRFFDFIGFNVYLDDPPTFRAYITRLRHLYPEKPVLLSECGFDSNNSRFGAQVHLAENLKSAYEAGIAGVFVFSWTDEWHTGGYDVTDWSFGLTNGARQAKPALSLVSLVYRCAPQCTHGALPKASVVVATYNGGRTLGACLQSLQNLDYPDYEIIVVDDGSTDNTAEILEGFNGIRVIRQPNRGLSVARNAGIEAATGEVIAFTDSDCEVDRDWLYHLVRQMVSSRAAGVGGPNITPPEGTLASKVVALAPGHATHVLISHQEAEHVPGCNMAFTRTALERVGGFDPVFRKAGDDVDIIWRMQDAGMKVGFSTAGFVWHHRRPTLRGYLRQQRGYGEADALVLRKHPHRFNDRGQSIWRGVIYPNRELRPLFGAPAVRYGVFGTGGYQCVYERLAGTWPFYVTSLEMWLVSALLAFAGLWIPSALYAGIAGAAASLGVSAVRAVQSWSMAPSRLPGYAFFVLWSLWVLQPIVRGTARYFHWLRTSMFSGIAPAPKPVSSPRDWPKVVEYWGEEGLWRIGILSELTRRMTERHWLFSCNHDWDPHDLLVPVSLWFKVLITTAEELHGGDKRLLRIRYRLAPTSLLQLGAVASGALALLVLATNDYWGRWIAVVMLTLLWFAWRSADTRRRKLQELADSVVRENGYVRIRKEKLPVPEERRRSSPPADRQLTEIEVIQRNSE